MAVGKQGDGRGGRAAVGGGWPIANRQDSGIWDHLNLSCKLYKCVMRTIHCDYQNIINQLYEESRGVSVKVILTKKSSHIVLDME